MLTFLGMLEGYRWRIVLSAVLAVAEAGGQALVRFLIGVALEA